MSQTNQYVSPQQVMYDPTHHTNYNKKPQPPADPASLEPGAVHLLEYRIPYTPHAVLHGTQHGTGAGSARCLLLPRRRIYAGAPSFESIRFAVPGSPGPTLGAIARGRAQLERPTDQVIAERATWSRIRCQIDWPGVEHTAVNIHTKDTAGAPLTREGLMKEVAAILIRFFKSSPQIQTQWSEVRLLALGYYRHSWVPILALDS